MRDYKMKNSGIPDCVCEGCGDLNHYEFQEDQDKRLDLTRNI